MKRRAGRLRKAGRGAAITAAALALLLGAIWAHHRLRTAEEASMAPPHRLVEVAGGQMSLYEGGQGETTLVFLSGAGTCSPILDFKSLYTLLEADCRIVVVEKFGYGCSDVLDRPRDLDTILSDTRAALRAAGIRGPYVLCPHSMSGLEAIYWAQQYPQEVSAIIGLDLAVPGHYEGIKIPLPLMRAAALGVRLGLTRVIFGIAERDAVTHGTLTQEEKEIYRALFHRRTATLPMLREAEAVKVSAAQVAAGRVPQIPVLLFLSNGDGTGFTEADWRGRTAAYFANNPKTRLVPLDCPHYVHDHAYSQIAAEILGFLEENTALP